MSAAQQELLRSFTQTGSTSNTPNVPTNHGSNMSIAQLLKAQLYVVTKDDIIDSLKDMILNIPKTDAYLEGEVKVHIFDEEQNNATIFGLLAAGTKPLDAILFMALKDDQHKASIFDVLPPLSIISADCSRYATKARGAFIAWATIIITRGGNPTTAVVAGARRALPKIITEKALPGYNIGFEDELCPECSSAPLVKFPSEALLDVDLTTFPVMYYRRMVLSPAGTRALRYAAMSSQFEHINPNALDSNADVRARQARAFELYYVLLEASKSEAACRRLHPMNTGNANRIPKFTDKMTHVVCYLLTEVGRQHFGAHIINNKMSSFMKDTNIMPDQATGRTAFSILKRTDADFMDVTAVNLKACLGI